jgi:citrate synthase
MHAPHLPSKIPTKAQAEAVSEELRRRAALPDYVKRVLEALPADAHPMTQFAAGILALQVDTPGQASHACHCCPERPGPPARHDALPAARLPLRSMCHFNSKPHSSVLTCS